MAERAAELATAVAAAAPDMVPTGLVPAAVMAEQAADLATVVAEADLDMVSTGLVPAAVMDPSQAEVEREARADLAAEPGVVRATAVREKVQAAVEPGVALAPKVRAPDPAPDAVAIESRQAGEKERGKVDMDMAVVQDITQASHREQSEEVLGVTASRVTVPTVFACQGRSVRSTVRKAELDIAHRLPREPGTLLAVMGREFLWNRTLVAFGLAKTVRNNRQPMDRDRKRGLAAERLLTEQISRAKAAQATSAHGISLAAAKREHRLIPMPGAFG